MSGGSVERRDFDARAIEGEQFFDRLEQRTVVAAEGHIDRDHVAVDVNVLDAGVGEEPSGQFVTMAVHLGRRRTGVTLVSHTGNRPVDLVTNHTGVRR